MGKLPIKLVLFFTSFTSLVLSMSFDSTLHPLSDEFIKIVNQKATTWKAGRNFPKETSLFDLQKRLGVLRRPEEKAIEKQFKHEIPENFIFPISFDARVNWNFCPSLSEIRDQGSCGSCWAISGAEVMTDRACIHSAGKKNFHYSTEDIVSCCPYCGNGCNGGYPDKAFDYWQEFGVVSGGPYNSSLGCYPYEIPADSEYHRTPECKDTCQNSYKKDFDEDKHYAKKSYKLNSEDKNIMYEIMTNGPVVADFFVFEDFYDYKSGVYAHTYGRYSGGHAIRILGYGEEDGVPYWLCANSWNYSWGDQGYFKILRGENECRIENHIVAGLPDFA